VDKYKNVSIVLVYRNISDATGTIYAAGDLSFRITSQAHPDLFETEEGGIAKSRSKDRLVLYGNGRVLSFGHRSRFCCFVNESSIFCSRLRTGPVAFSLQ
jgi:hypothetical protein